LASQILIQPTIFASDGLLLKKGASEDTPGARDFLRWNASGSFQNVS